MILLARWQAAILLYLCVAIVLIAVRPPLLFDPEYRAKAFGAQNTALTSVFAPAFVFPLLAFVIYYILACIELAWPSHKD